MHDLQLVGFTTDRRGLIFRSAAGARGDSYVVPLTDELLAVVAELTADVDDADGAEEVAAVADTRVRVDEDVDARPRSMLSVRDIQARLRAGESTAQVASEAGVDGEWIERFAPPVRAEQRRVVEQALECHVERARSGKSAVPLRRAVGMAMADKGIAFTIPAFEAAWSSHLIGHDRWAVTFTYRHRGRDHTATWVYDADADELTTSDRIAAQLGYVPGGAKVRDDAGVAVDGIIGDPGATTQIGVAEPAPRRRRARASTPATADVEAAPAKNVSRKKAASARKASRKKAASTRVPVTKSPTKRSPAKTAGSKPAAPRTAAPKKAAPSKPAPKKPAPKKAAPKKAAPKKAAPKKAAPKKAAPQKAPAARPATRRAPPKPPPTPARAVPTPVAATGPSLVARREPPVPSPASPPPRPLPTGDDERLRIRSRRVAARPVPSDRPGLDARDIAPRPGAVHLAEVPLAPAPPHRPEAPIGNGRPATGRPAELDRVPDAPDLVDTTAADRAVARRARAAERNAPTVQFRSGSAVPVRRAEANGAGRAAPRRQLRAR